MFKFGVRGRILSLAATAAVGVLALGTTFINSNHHIGEIQQRLAQAEASAGAAEPVRTALAGVDASLDEFAGEPSEETKTALLNAVDEVSAAVEEGGVVTAAVGPLTQDLPSVAEGYARKLEEMGFSQNQGIIGSLRAAVHEVESRLNTAGEGDASLDGLIVNMLMLRRNEKDFMLRGDPKYVGQFGEGVTTLAEALEQSPLPKETVSSLRGLLENYSEQFQLWVEGSASLEEAETRIRKAVASANAVTEEVLAEQLAERHARTEELAAGMEAAEFRTFVLVAAVIAAVLVVSLLIGRSILRPVRDVGQALRRVATGRTDVAIVNTFGQTDLGEMIDAINTMALDLAEMSHAAESIAKGDLRANVT
ncbi:HAMP domain-containing protein, partial [Palleronia sp.]|uniref:HAMP domain-containing protein n=1 Tax=Palleronia sp. TaxID=1940284 RepID=UPI0035C8032D